MLENIEKTKINYILESVQFINLNPNDYLEIGHIFGHFF